MKSPLQSFCVGLRQWQRSAEKQRAGAGILCFGQRSRSITARAIRIKSCHPPEHRLQQIRHTYLSDDCIKEQQVTDDIWETFRHGDSRKSCVREEGRVNFFDSKAR